MTQQERRNNRMAVESILNSSHEILQWDSLHRPQKMTLEHIIQTVMVYTSHNEVVMTEDVAAFLAEETAQLIRRYVRSEESSR